MKLTTTQTAIALGTTIGALCAVLFSNAIKPNTVKAQVTVIQLSPKPTASPTPTKTPPAKQLRRLKYTGTASYYSKAGCVGCSPTLTMANGQTLDDTRLTVAFNRAPQNSYVTVRNLENDHIVTAQVTDTGGFEKLHRIIDLTVATRDAIKCSNLCKVEVTLL